MPVKRSRIGRSSSFGETGLINMVSQPPVESRWSMRTDPADFSAAKRASNSARIVKPSVEKEEEVKPRILTVSSPIRVSGSDISVGVGTGGFLERCYSCKKKIGQKDEVFMYGYLRAFCSPECRDKQIFVDRKMENFSEELTGGAAGPSRMNDANNLFVSYADKHAVPKPHMN